MADINSSLPVTDTADGATGSAAPSTAIEVGGSDGTNLRAISVDTTGKVNINNISGTISLPTGAATSANQTNGSQKTEVVDGSGNIQPAGDVLTRKIFVQPTDGTNNQGYTASSEAKVLVTPLTNSSVVKAQLQDNAGTAITLGQKVMASSVPVVLSSDQTGINTFLDKNGSGTISALNGAVTITANGCSEIYLSITGTWVATLTLQGDSGDGTWAGLEGVVAFPSGALANIIGSNASLMIPCGGYKQVRIIATAYTSGTATITWNAGAGVSLVQVFNSNPVALNAQVVGTAADGAAASGNPVQMGGKDGSSNIQTILTDTAGNQAVLLKDASANGITSSTLSGTTASKQGLDVVRLSPVTNYYSAPVSIRQTAASAANSTVWAMRNAAASTKTVVIERIYLLISFDAGTPITRSFQRYDLVRFSAATPTAGTAVTVVLQDSSNAATQVTDVRFLDTGLTTTGVTFGTSFATVGVPASDGATNVYVRDVVGFKLAPGEGFAIRLNTAAVIGQDLDGEIVWSER